MTHTHKGGFDHIRRGDDDIEMKTLQPCTSSWGKFQPSKVMTVENEGILAITRSSAIICNRLEVPNRQGNYPFSKFTS